MARPGSIAALTRDSRVAGAGGWSRDLHVEQRPVVWRNREVLQRHDARAVLVDGPIQQPQVRVGHAFQIVEERAAAGPHQLAGVQGLLAEGADFRKTRP